MKLTVIICAHNPRRHYLARVLSGLRQQTLPMEEWELLLVDNVSIYPLAARWDISWHPNGHHVLEPELGLAYARIRGIKLSQTPIIVFVDDDNVLNANYLTEAAKISQECPHFGTWGAGVIVPDFEAPPDPAFKELLPYLALRNDPQGQGTPWGAGLCIRKNVGLTYIRLFKDSEIVLTGRRGFGLMSGEDNELTYTAYELGLSSAVFPQLRLTHLISKERVTRDYLVAIYHGTEMSNALLDYKWDGILPKSPFTVRGIRSILNHAVFHRGIKREMFFARVRAVMSARRQIAQTFRLARPLRSKAIAAYYQSSTLPPDPALIDN